MRNVVQKPNAFYVIRHGQTEWNERGLFQGRSDIPLNEVGKAQAQKAATGIKKAKVTKVLVSPLRRALETAEIIFKDQHVIMETEDALIECDFGCFEGKPITDIIRENRVSRKEQLKEILPDDGEQWSSLLERGEKLLDKVSELQRNNHYVALVGHDAVIQGLSELLIGSWFDAEHGEIYQFCPDDKSWRAINRQPTSV